ncbi:hypothetical protein F4802DRAFT_545781 [Xylaria palmicola]|nr:hypothetical protein F4802DRAFT_545781 [Xylaria palmicola]
MRPHIIEHICPIYRYIYIRLDNPSSPHTQSLPSTNLTMASRSHSKQSSLLQMALLRKLEAINDERFEWLLDIRQSLLGSWQASREKYMEWLREADATVTQLASSGDVEGAKLLANTILKHPSVHNPAEFEVAFLSGHGAELFCIKGTPHLPSTPEIGEIQMAQPNAGSRDVEESSGRACAKQLNQGGKHKKGRKGIKSTTQQSVADEVSARYKAAPYASLPRMELLGKLKRRGITPGRKVNNKGLVFKLLRDDFHQEQQGNSN